MKVITTLAPTAPWPYPRCIQVMQPAPNPARTWNPGPKPSVEPNVLAHLQKHQISTATHMIAHGAACNSSNVYRALRDLLDRGLIMEAPNPNKHKHPTAKYYTLKDGLHCGPDAGLL